ncbi:carbohydrate ABC transporter permease [Luedemannella flava]|uniref:Carbohydrate ABC transporter permease n=1 Tax=Luedemannella flava TaxID=349316 RepID=A0ABN2MV68_9ACTN
MTVVDIQASSARQVGRTVLLIALAVVLIYPVAWLIGSSVKSPNEIIGNLSVIPEDITWSNYVHGWTGLPSATFGTFFLNSTLIAVATVVANTVSCALTAYAFARLRFPLRGWWFSVMICTLLLPSHVLIVPQYALFRWLGWVNTPLPLIVPKLLATEAFFVFLMVQFIRGIPRDLDEAAKVDGCSPYTVFLNVIMPLSRPALVTTAILSFIWTWNDFLTQLIYLPDVDRQTAPIGLSAFVVSGGETALGPLFAMSVLSLLPVLLFFVGFQRLLSSAIQPARLRR